MPDQLEKPDAVYGVSTLRKAYKSWIRLGMLRRVMGSVRNNYDKMNNDIMDKATHHAGPVRVPNSD